MPIMKTLAAVVAVVLASVLALGGATDQQAQGPSSSAVAKVIQMLSDMSLAAKKEKDNEEIAFAKFSTYCKTEAASLADDIKTAGEEIEYLGAEIEKLTSDAKLLGEKIAKLQAGQADDEAEQKSQTKQRHKEHAEFLAEQQDYAESVDALERAILVLQKQNYDRPATADALIQLSDSDRLPAQARQIIASFVHMLDSDDEDAADGKDPMDYSAPEANAYEFQSSSIIDLLKKLRAEFSDKKGDCEKEEMNSAHAYDMIMQDLTDTIENAKKSIEEKTAAKEAKLGKAALDKKSLSADVAGKAEDEKTLEALKIECSDKKLSFEEKQKLRSDEIEAIQKAIEIMKSPDVTGSSDTYFSLSQKRATALLQIGESTTATTREQGVRRQVREFLTVEAQRLKSKPLSVLAMKIASDPFGKVKKMIDDMITRLLEEANADANKEGYCDTEMGKSKVTRNKLNEDIDALTAAIEGGKSTIMELTEEMGTLLKEVADLEKGMGEATDLRNEEKAKNKATVEDALAGQRAVTAATAILKDFYEQAAIATAFVQTSSLRQPIKMYSEEWERLANPNFEGTIETGYTDMGTGSGHKKGMQTFGETYAGQQDEAGGVLALMEVVLSDFATLEADTKAAEDESQQAYKAFMAQSKKSVATKKKKVEMDTTDKADAEAKLQEDVADLKRTQDELLAADRYHEEIEDQCIDKGMTFEERTKAREEEIASLKQALKILGSEDIA